ncbi:MAG: type IX secretion system outer membrane channel protein PorV [Paludibacter sp.]|nr:type IX secretion system outer membrane channel protein PorV [Paludibacter sp.]MDD4198254.1 type IX secretion system outer membrane channel protein PorV [Paludibacter sp.]MDD4428044.1 type IX secretion system outer membrane channel protein PorV [Paludibacter sp.]
MKKISFLFILLFAVHSVLFSEEAPSNPIISAVPSLTISPDARGAGMGDVGAATSSDVSAQFWNPAKYVFAESDAGLVFSFTPWLRQLVSDINLTYLAGYWKFDQRRALSASLRYFSLGKVLMTDYTGRDWAKAYPNEFAVDVAYSQKLFENFSAAAALRFIYSDLNNGTNMAGGSEIYPGVAVAADVAMYYKTPVQMYSGDGSLAFGLNVSNIGSKISYDERASSSFIPANIRLGTSFDYPIDEYQRLSFSADAYKMLVPTMDYTKTAENINYYNEMTSLQGILSSFNDAPGGYKEELQEISWSAGAEYVYNNQFSVRAGYFNEHQNKGNRKFFTAGAGFKLNVFQLDASYIISIAQTSPLDQTLRFSLSFDLFGLQNLMR